MFTIIWNHNLLLEPREFECIMNWAIEEKNHNLCKSLLHSESNGDICKVRLSLLKEVFETNDTKIEKMVFRSVVPKMLKEFQTEFSKILVGVNVWIGIQCSCEKKTEEYYKKGFCSQTKPLFIVDNDWQEIGSSTFPNHFLGYQIVYDKTRPSHADEAKIISDEMAKDPKRHLDKIPGSIAKEMFRSHSNLTMICPSGFKSRGFKSGSFPLEKINCIQLFCKRKGIIPIGESHFPLHINGIPTDVLEGTSVLSRSVHIGDKIDNDAKCTGTLGGFVKYYGIDTFLTCSHVIFGKDDFFKLQNRDIHIKCHISRNKDVQEPVECILIRHVLKCDSVEKAMELDGEIQNSLPSQEHPDETSIDAALLLIQIPKTSNLRHTTCTQLINSNALPEDKNATTSSTSDSSLPDTSSIELGINLQSGDDTTQTQFTEYGMYLRSSNPTLKFKLKIGTILKEQVCPLATDIYFPMKICRCEPEDFRFKIYN